MLRYFLIFIFIFSCGVLPAKTITNLDSLEQILKNGASEQGKFIACKEIAKAYIHKDPAKAWMYLNRATAMAKAMNDSSDMAIAEYLKGNFLFVNDQNDSAAVVLLAASERLKKYNLRSELSYCYFNLGGNALDNSNYPQASFWFGKAEEIARQEKDETLLSESLMNLGVVTNQIGNRPKGLLMLQEALAIAEKNNNKKNISQILLYIGSAYSESSNEDYALRYFERAQQISLSEKDTSLMIEAEMFIGNSHYYGKRYEKAVEMYKKVMKLSEKKDKKVYAGAIGNIGNVYADMGDNKTALEYQFKAIELFEKLQDRQGLTICYSAIGSCYRILKEYKKALEFYNKAYVIAAENNSFEDLIEIHLGLAKTYEALNDYKNAYENFKLYKQFNDSIYNESNTKKITEIEMNNRFASQQKEQELIEKNKETLANENLKRQQLLTYASIAGIALLLLLVGFVLRNNAQRKKVNTKLKQFNNEVLHQKEVIEYKNKEITDSINYAKRIQESILPVKKDIEQAFKESFVLFKPRNVVSGDFYWFAKHKDKNIIACVDCTGHGVPGAFMSMIGNTLLNEIVNEKGITKPSEILSLLHKRVRQSLKQDLENNETRDGMDIALCSIDHKTGKLEYAGANRGLYIIREGNSLEEIKPTKSPIGGDKMEDREFINNEIAIASGDRIYMTTDGYADQFGGEHEKKFMVRQFQKLLIGICDLPMEKQGDELKKAMEKWQGNMEQVDDILVIGIKI